MPDTTDLSDRIAKAIGSGYGYGVLYRDVMSEVRPEMARKDAEIERLREYAETTRYHQQKHREAVREIARLRGERRALWDLLKSMTRWKRQLFASLVEAADERCRLLERLDERPAATEGTDVVLCTCGQPDKPGHCERCDHAVADGAATVGTEPEFAHPESSDEQREYPWDQQ